MKVRAQFIHQIIKNIASASKFMLGDSSTGPGFRVSSVKKVFALCYLVLVYMPTKITGEAQHLRQELSPRCVQ